MINAKRTIVSPGRADRGAKNIVTEFLTFQF